MGKPLVSFIIAYYNLPVSMLCECIDSILALSLSPSEREIIVIDDGSVNSPVNELMPYGDSVVYIRQSHQGLSVARNKGIQVATATYLQFVDADDRLLPLPYEHCISLLRASMPEMVLFNLTHDSSSKTASTYTDVTLKSGSQYMLRHNIHGSACGYLFSRSILGNLRFTPGICHEDEEFTPLLLLRAERLIVTDAQAYFYQQRQDSITSSSDIRHRLWSLNDTKDIIQRLHTAADRLPYKDRQALQRRVAQLTMDYLYNIIRYTRSRHYLKRKIQELRRLGLYPLPAKAYTLKYTLFRLLV